MIIKLNQFILEKVSESQEIIAYHSSHHDNITDFNFNEYYSNPGSSTRIDGIFFSNVPQHSWGDTLYKVKIITKNPVIYDLRESKFDSLSIQEAFDALLRGETYYIKNDLMNENENYEEMEEDDIWDVVESWRKNLDLIIINGENYAQHNTEYIVPNSHYNTHSAKIIILEKMNRNK